MKKRWTALLLAAVLCTGCTPTAQQPSVSGGVFQPGRYQGTGEGYGGPITVEVEVSADRIEAVSILSHNESRGICEAAFEEIPAEILRQGTPYVELVAGATLTSQGVVEAAADALSKAGGTFEPPEPEEEVRTQRELFAGLVIAGGGGAGLTAAAEAAEDGGATVLLLEQQEILGGETLYEPVLTLEDGSVASGYGVLGDLRAQAEEGGAELLTGVKLTGLTVEDGRVTGVTAAGEDTDYVIHASEGVILATGDYGANPELVLDHTGDTELAALLREHFRTLSGRGSDGSGLEAAMEIGAAAVGLDCLELRDSAPEQRQLGESRTLACTDSTGALLTVPEEDDAWIRSLLALPEGTYWALGDADTLPDGPAQPENTGGTEGRLVTAQTLEELAAAMGADPAVLTASAERYNAAAPEENRLDRAPYYAEARTPVLAETPGGLRTDENGRVLREDGSVLEGLWAVGGTAAGVGEDGSVLYTGAERSGPMARRAARTALGLPPEPVEEEEPGASDASSGQM